MQCLLCRKRISRLRVWKTKSEFCCDEHADTYKKQTLDRLLRDQEQLLHNVSAPPLPISDDLTDDGLDTVLAGGNETEGLDRSHLLVAPELADTNLDAVGVELSDTQRAKSLPAESLDDILSRGQQGATPDDVHEQSPEDALAALRRLAEPSPAKPLDIASAVTGARAAEKDEPLAPLERLAAGRNVDTRELLHEVISGSDVTSEGSPDQTGAGLEFGGSEEVEKEQASGGTPSMLDRLMEAGPADEPSQALPMPAIGERLELDDAPSPDGSLGSESDAGEIDSPVEARAAESPADQFEVDAPSESDIPVWLREFTAETSGMEDPVTHGLAEEESYEPDPDDVRFSEIEALEKQPENPALARPTFRTEEESDHENKADGSPDGTLNSADWLSDVLQNGASEAADQTQAEGDIELPENAAAETARPADELEPGDLDADWVAAAEKSPATSGEDHEALESLLDGLAGTAEDGGKSHGRGSSAASGEAHAGQPMRNVVRFPDPDELARLKAASSQKLAENNEPPPDGAQSSSDTQRQWTPWLEMMGVELSAQEPAESDALGQDPETAKAEMMPGGIGEYVGLPLGVPQAAFALRFIPSLELTPAGSPRLNSEIQDFAPDQSGSTTPLIAETAICRARPTLRPISPWTRLTPVEGLLAVEPRIADSAGNGLLQQADMAVPIPELQSPNRVAARTPLKPIASARRPEIFEALWLPVPQLLDLAEQPADKMHGDLIRSKVECRLSFPVDIRYGLSVNACHVPPSRLLRCFWPAWADLPQQPVAYEVQSPSIEPRSAPHMPEPLYRGIGGGRATFPRVETLLMAMGADERTTLAMAWQPDADLDIKFRAGLAHTDKPLDDFGREVQDWRAEPIGPLLALHGPENLDPCEYA